MTALQIVAVAALAVCSTASRVRAEDLIADWKGTAVRLQEGDVLSNGVKIHYHTESCPSSSPRASSTGSRRALIQR